MKIIADTNILARAALDDDLKQSEVARKLLGEATAITLPLVALCELAWLMTRSYRLDRAHVAASIRFLLQSENVICDRTAVEAGIAMMEAGGDFADGVIALEGRRLGGDVFVTFDRKAAALLRRAGYESLAVTAE